ncbi:MAG TPA: hypothetical protein VIY52_33080 [Streptosporangiaceae bacterium]
MGSSPQPTPPERQPLASDPEPPASQPGNGEHPPPAQPDGREALRGALANERRLRKDAQIKLARLRQQHMSDDENALQAARDEGRADAYKAAGLRVAAAEFRAVAAGKLASPAAALEVLDLSRFVGDKGEVDLVGLTTIVDKLAVVSTSLHPDWPAGHLGQMTQDQPETPREQLAKQAVAACNELTTHAGELSSEAAHAVCSLREALTSLVALGTVADLQIANMERTMEEFEAIFYRGDVTTSARLLHRHLTLAQRAELARLITEP